MRSSFVLLAFICVTLSCGSSERPFSFIVDDHKEAAHAGPRRSVRLGRNLSRISQIRIGTTRRGPGKRSPSFPHGTQAVYCTFDARDLTSGTTITVRWRKAGVDVARSEFAELSGTMTLTADLSSNAPLPSGTYRVEFRVNDNLAESASFAIGGAPATTPTSQGNSGSRGNSAPQEGPRISNLLLAATDCMEDQSATFTPGQTLDAVTNAVHLCLDYHNMGDGVTLEIRWFDDSTPQHPLATTSYAPNGSGSLSSAYTYDSGPLPDGSYFVTISLDGHHLARADFRIQR